jgi:hypothetical protein
VSELDRRRRNVDWHVGDKDGVYPNMRDGVAVAVLMDIRDELRRLNTLLHCSNFIDMPRVLRQVRANTAKPRKKRDG